MKWKRCIPLAAAFMLVVALAVPARAASFYPIDYNDFVTNVTYEGETNLVTVELPQTFVDKYTAWYLALGSTSLQGIKVIYGRVAEFATTWDPDAFYTVKYYPTGYERVWDLSYIPSGTSVTIKFGFTMDDMENPGDHAAWFGPNYPGYQLFFYDSEFNQISAKSYYPDSGDVDYVVKEGITVTFTLDKPANARYVRIDGILREITVSDGTDVPQSGALYFKALGMSMTMSVDSLVQLQQQTGKTNQLLEDILSGGSSGSDLVGKGDQISDIGSGLTDDIGQIQDFENEYMGQLDSNMEDIVGAADLSLLTAPLFFVQSYVNGIVDGIPKMYMVIFTLPIFLGIFFFIVQHPVKAPRPDTSGDQVTRETFTETTILTGPNAGRTTSTRTVTTSQEIGRVHNE